MNTRTISLITLALVALSIASKLPTIAETVRVEVLRRALRLEMAAETLGTLTPPQRRKVIVAALAGGPIGVYDTSEALTRVWYARAVESSRAAEAVRDAAAGDDAP